MTCASTSAARGAKGGARRAGSRPSSSLGALVVARASARHGRAGSSRSQRARGHPPTRRGVASAPRSREIRPSRVRRRPAPLGGGEARREPRCSATLGDALLEALEPGRPRPPRAQGCSATDPAVAAPPGDLASALSARWQPGPGRGDRPRAVEPVSADGARLGAATFQQGAAASTAAAGAAARRSEAGRLSAAARLAVELGRTPRRALGARHPNARRRAARAAPRARPRPAPDAEQPAVSTAGAARPTSGQRARVRPPTAPGDGDGEVVARLQERATSRGSRRRARTPAPSAPAATAAAHGRRLLEPPARRARARDDLPRARGEALSVRRERREVESATAHLLARRRPALLAKPTRRAIHRPAGWRRRRLQASRGPAGQPMVASRGCGRGPPTELPITRSCNRI